ncbi:hypothetical protein B6U90_00280 [Thermoplasmatales archaeon ex4484_6]|nr:MAG: hypothetical protein B6U90_00280 [Thermoplasmatales archaeon ex4484_6]
MRSPFGGAGHTTPLTMMMVVASVSLIAAFNSHLLHDEKPSNGLAELRFEQVRMMGRCAQYLLMSGCTTEKNESFADGEGVLVAWDGREMIIHGPSHHSVHVFEDVLGMTPDGLWSAAVIGGSSDIADEIPGEVVSWHSVLPTGERFCLFLPLERSPCPFGEVAV